MRRLVLLALLVPLAAGCGFLGGWAPYPGAVASSHRTVPATTVPIIPEPVSPVQLWTRVERLPPQARPGATLFAASGCTVCHTYAGTGTRELHAPDLTAIGRRRLGIGFEIRHLQCPSCVAPGSPMPSFARLGRRRLRQLAVFLEDSNGVR